MRCCVAAEYLWRRSRLPLQDERGGANWALLHLDGNRTLEPVIEELIRPVQTRYDLDW